MGAQRAALGWVWLVLLVLALALVPCAVQQGLEPPGLPQPPPETTHECTEQHPDFPDQRVCIFQNLLLHNNTVYYVSSSLTEFAPPLYVAWEEMWSGHNRLHIRVVPPAAAAALLSGAEVHDVPVAGLFHQQHPYNFYHLFTEVAPTMHYVLCKHLGRCAYEGGAGDPVASELRLFWINRMDAAISPRTLEFRAPPPIEELLRCFTPHPVLNILNATLPEEEGEEEGRRQQGAAAGGGGAAAPRAFLLRRAVAGLPRAARYYHQKRAELQARLSDPPPLEYMASYRRRVADCLGYNFVDAVAPTRPLRVTLINRHYEAGRSILNVQTLKERILEMPVIKRLGPGGAVVDVVYLQGGLREQAAVLWNTSIYLWAHGAAMAQTFFLPRGAQAIELVQWVVDDPADQHVWVQGIQRAFQLDIGLGVVTNEDRRRVFFNYDYVMAPGSQYWRFNETEKVMLWEDLKCPEFRSKERHITGATCFHWFHWGMSVVWRFELIRPKLHSAVDRLLQRVAELQGPALIAEGAPGMPAARGLAG